jgi:hypothetical protein
MAFRSFMHSKLALLPHRYSLTASLLAVASLLFFSMVLIPLLQAQAQPGPNSFDSLSQKADAARDADRLNEAIALRRR